MAGTLGTLALVISHCVAWGVQPLALDNGLVRVEVDPEVFSVRFIGAPGGTNFLQPAYVSSYVRAQDEWCDPGGLTTFIGPELEGEPAFLRGPAEVLEYTATRITLLGPKSDFHAVRIRKVFQIDAQEPHIMYEIAVLSDTEAPLEVRLKSTASLNPRTVVRIGATELDQKTRGEAAQGGQPAKMDGQSLALALESDTASAITEIELDLNTVEYESDGLVLARRTSLESKDKSLEQDFSFQCLLDGERHELSTTFVSPARQVDQWSPLIVREEWTLSREKQS